LASAFGPSFPAVAAAASINGHLCSSLVVRTDRGNYDIGEVVNITVTFVSLLPGCVEPMIAHDYVVKIDVLNVSNQTVFSSSNVTARALMISEVWTPESAGEYTIIASAYFRLLGDESMAKMLESSATICVHDIAQQIPEFGLLTVGVLGIGVAALSLLIRERRKRFTRSELVTGFEASTVNPCIQTLCDMILVKMLEWAAARDSS
jgi:hypothetical protein